MKKLLLPILAILLVVGCKKDDDTDDTDNNNEGAITNSFRLITTDYSLGTALIYHQGLNSNSTYDQKLTLLSSDFTLSTSNDTIDNVTGTGDGVSFTFYSDSENGIAGTYTYSNAGTNGVFTFDRAGYAIGEDMNLGTNTASGNLENNNTTLTITSQGGNSYSISLTGKDDSNNDFTITYTGTVSIYQYASEFF